MRHSVSQSARILAIYESLRTGHTIEKSILARKFGVDERTIQRDIDSIRDFLSEQIVDGADVGTIIYDRKEKGFVLKEFCPPLLSNSEILAVCKILLESRSMVKEEMLPLLDKLVARCVPEEHKKAVGELIANEKYHYIEPHHGKPVLNGLWEIGQAIQDYRIMEIEYERIKAPGLVKRTVEPVGIMFSEYYFYLTAFLRDVDRSAEFENANDLFPTIYRVDRIRAFKVLDDAPTVDMRHILIQPETTDEDKTNESNAKVPTAEAMEAAKTKAQSILDEWKAGAATEETFATLAEEHSADGRDSEGKLANPIYDHVREGDMVPNIDKWLFDSARKPGDVDLVDYNEENGRYYGWHIVYFVGQNEPYWKKAVTDAKQENDHTDWLKKITEETPAEAADGMKYVGASNTATPTPSATPAESVAPTDSAAPAESTNPTESATPTESVEPSPAQ